METRFFVSKSRDEKTNEYPDDFFICSIASLTVILLAFNVISCEKADKLKQSATEATKIALSKHLIILLIFKINKLE